MGSGTCPLGIIAGEPVAELDVGGIGEKACVEEEDHVLLSGLDVSLRSGDSVGRAGIICPTSDCSGWAKRVRLIGDVGCVYETFGGGEPERTVGGSRGCWVGGSAAFAGAHAVPFAENDRGKLGLPTLGNLVQFREREPHDATRSSQPKMAILIFDGSVDEKRCNATGCRERRHILLMYPGETAGLGAGPGVAHAVQCK